MPYTDQDKAFLKKMKDQGVSQDDAFNLLDQVHQKLGVNQQAANAAPADQGPTNPLAQAWQTAKSAPQAPDQLSEDQNAMIKQKLQEGVSPVSNAISGAWNQGISNVNQGGQEAAQEAQQLDQSGSLLDKVKGIGAGMRSEASQGAAQVMTGIGETTNFLRGALGGETPKADTTDVEQSMRDSGMSEGDIKAAIKVGGYGKPHALSGPLDAAGGVMQILGSPFTATANSSFPVASQAAKVVNTLFGAPVQAVSGLFDVIQTATGGKTDDPEYQRFKKHLNTILAGVEMVGIPKLAEMAKEKVANMKATDSASRFEPAMKGFAKDQAIEEGRVQGGKKSILFGNSGAKVEPSDLSKEADRIMAENNPATKKMDKFQLIPEISKQIVDMSTALEPKLQEANLPSGKWNGTLDEWNKLKKQQADSLQGQNHATALKKYQNFIEKNILNPITEAKQNVIENPATGTTTPEPNLNDVWKARINLDKETPSGVKTPSRGNLKAQAANTWWNQTRGLLTDIIEKSDEILGPEASDTFSKLRTLYEAKRQMKTNMPINTKGTPGLVGKIISPLVKSGLEGTAIGKAAGLFTNNTEGP